MQRLHKILRNPIIEEQPGDFDTMSFRLSATNQTTVLTYYLSP